MCGLKTHSLSQTLCHVRYSGFHVIMLDSFGWIYKCHSYRETNRFNDMQHSFYSVAMPRFMSLGIDDIVDVVELLFFFEEEASGTPNICLSSSSNSTRRQRNQLFHFHTLSSQYQTCLYPSCEHLSALWGFGFALLGELCPMKSHPL